MAIDESAIARPPMGRGVERAALRRYLDDALGGRGALVLIGGAAGIGKTTLAEAVCGEAAARGALVLVGRSYDLSDTPPYGPWLDLAQRLPATEGPPPPLLAERGDTAGSAQAEPAAAILDFVAALAARRPLILFLDDLQWADPASIDVLRRVARAAGDLPLLILAAYRADELVPAHPLYRLLPILVREARVIRIDLRPLDDDEQRAVVAARYPLASADLDRLATWLAARAEGNPFFLEELLRALEDEGGLVRPAGGAGRWTLGDLDAVGVPPLLRQVLDRRLDRLPLDERGALTVAAVIGQEVPLALWAAVAVLDEETAFSIVERGVAARVLDALPDGATVRFTHALVRQALYEAVLPPRRRIWHRRVAEATLGDARPDPDIVAYHFRLAADERAREWLIRAGERAQRDYAWLTAAVRFEAALDLIPETGDAHERARLLAALAQLRRYTEPAEGIARLAEAERLALAVGDRALAASTRFDRGHLRCMARDFARGIDEMVGALPALEALSAADRAALPALDILGVAPAERAGYHRGVLVLFLAVVGRLAEARVVGAAARAEGDETTAREYLARGWVAALLGQPDEARRAFRDSRAAYGEQHWEVGTTLLYELDLVALPYRTDRLIERRALADDGEAAWRRASGALADLPPSLASLPLLLVEGRWDEARATAEATLASTESSEAWRRFPARFLGALHREAGEIESGWVLVRQEFPAGPATAPGATWFQPALAIQRLAAKLALDAGNLAGARAWLEAYDRWLAWSGAILGRAESALLWAAHDRAVGDPAGARRWATQALARATEPHQPLALLAAERLLGELNIDAGRHAEAAAHLDRALALAAACADPPERALGLLARARLRRATGDDIGAQGDLAEARATFERLGARRALAQADALADAPSAASPIATPADLPDGLSPREWEVLALIAGGDNNAEIADTLSLSVRTVERHINNLYRKIDARGRADAVAYAARHGLVPG